MVMISNERYLKKKKNSIEQQAVCIGVRVMSAHSITKNLHV